jgi:hypothetical protein
MINPVTNLPFTSADVDRILGMADCFLEDWENNEGHPNNINDPLDGDEARECAERRKEWDALRPLIVARFKLTEPRFA